MEPNRFSELARVDGICPYFTRFPLSFPGRVLVNASRGDQVLDPFCGSGTSLLAARILGLRATGIDCSPLAVAIARAKLVGVLPGAVAERARRVLATEDTPALEIPEEPFWRRCFADPVLNAMCRFRAYFMSHELDDIDIFFRALVLGLLHGPSRGHAARYYSAHMPGWHSPSKESLLNYWSRRRLLPPDVDVLETLGKRAQYLLSGAPEPVKSVVFLGDSRHRLECIAQEQDFDWVITSPPYFGYEYYQQSQWLRLWMLGGEPNGGDEIGHADASAYTTGLAQVWRRCAHVCRPGATLAVRYGIAASCGPIDPCHLLAVSLEKASAGWSVVHRRPVPRQTIRGFGEVLFGAPVEQPRGEFELIARLDG